VIRRITILSLVLIAVLLIATPVLAYLYRAQVSITESNGTDYDMLGVVWDQNNDYLADNGYMDADALDTRVQSLGGTDYPWLVGDDKTLTATTIDGNGQVNLYFVTGETPATDMDIVPGYEGYVTISDAAALELGNNFKLELAGYIDTDNAVDLVSKSSSASLYTDGAGNLVGGIDPTIPVEQEDTSGHHTMVNTSTVRSGQRIDDLPAGTYTKVSFYLTDNGAANGLCYARLRRVSDDGIIGTFGELDATTISGGGAYTWYDFDTTPVVNPSEQDVYVSFEYANNASIFFSYKSPDCIFGKDFSYTVAGGYTEHGNIDSTYKLYGTPRWGAEVSTALTTGDYKVEFYADGSDLYLEVDDSVEDTTGLGGASAPDNANDWVLDCDPYWEYYEHTVSGTLIVDYDPEDIISGTTLPDLEGAAQDGAITWGSNPAGISVAVGSLVSSGQGVVGEEEETETSDILPPAGTTDWAEDPDVTGALLTNPMRPIVVAVSDNTSLSERQVWVYGGLVILLLVTAGVSRIVHGHHLITGVAAAAIVIALSVMTIWPLWALVFTALAVVGGLVAERSPSL